jgi:hypothetical protein
MEYGWIDVQSKDFIGVTSPPTLNGLQKNYGISTIDASLMAKYKRSLQLLWKMQNHHVI